MSRELTKEEVRDIFLQHVRDSIDYWEKLPNKTLHERMEGAVFSILVAIDGEDGELPAFHLIPFPHSDEKQYCIDRGENYYPPSKVEDGAMDIAGDLHHNIEHQKFYGKEF